MCHNAWRCPTEGARQKSLDNPAPVIARVCCGLRLKLAHYQRKYTGVTFFLLQFISDP